MNPADRSLMLYIQRTIAATGCPPRFEDMRAHMDLSSRSRVTQMLGRLTRDGFIERTRYKARSILIKRAVPDDRLDAAARAALEAAGAKIDSINLATVRSAITTALLQTAERQP